MATMMLLQTLVGGKDAGWYSEAARARRAKMRFEQDVQDRWRQKYRQQPGSENDEAGYLANTPTLESIRASDPDLVAAVYKRGKDGQYSPRTGKRVIDRYSTREELGWDPLDASWRPEPAGGNGAGTKPAGGQEDDPVVGAPPPITATMPPGTTAGGSTDPASVTQRSGVHEHRDTFEGTARGGAPRRYRGESAPGGQAAPRGMGERDLAAVFASLLGLLSAQPNGAAPGPIQSRTPVPATNAMQAEADGAASTRSGTAPELMRNERRVLRALRMREGQTRQMIGLGGR